MWAKAEAATLECLVQRVDAWLEPGSFESEAEVLDAKLEQSLIGPCCPRESS